MVTVYQILAHELLRDIAKNYVKSINKKSESKRNHQVEINEYKEKIAEHKAEIAAYQQTMLDTQLGLTDYSAKAISNFDKLINEHKKQIALHKAQIAAYKAESSLLTSENARYELFKQLLTPQKTLEDYPTHQKCGESDTFGMWQFDNLHNYLTENELNASLLADLQSIEDYSTIEKCFELCSKIKHIQNNDMHDKQLASLDKVQKDLFQTYCNIYKTFSKGEFSKSQFNYLKGTFNKLWQSFSEERKQNFNILKMTPIEEYREKPGNVTSHQPQRQITDGNAKVDKLPEDIMREVPQLVSEIQQELLKRGIGHFQLGKHRGGMFGKNCGTQGGTKGNLSDGVSRVRVS